MRSRILNREFKYDPSYATDIRKTFARLRRGQKKNPGNVMPLKPGTPRKRGLGGP